MSIVRRSIGLINILLIVKLVNYWPFIEAYYPNYDSCDQILLSDILARKLEGEEIDIKDEEMIKDWDVKEELLKLDQTIILKAMENYFETKYFEIKCKLI